MDVKIYPNNFNAFITAEKVVDENHQPLNDYVCNVTYTNLKDGQIAEIGQQFAKHLSDTDENGNSKAGLHKVALTGNYAQLENKPSASNLQEFHKVAFSGKTSDLNNDKGFLTNESDPVFTVSPAANITNNDLINIQQLDNIINNQENNTLRISTLEQEQVKVIRINVIDNPYNLTNFGLTSFCSTTTTLIQDIIDLLENINPETNQIENNIIILKGSENKTYLVTHYKANTPNSALIQIPLISLSPMQYDNFIQNMPIQEDGEDLNDYINRCNNYLNSQFLYETEINFLIYDSSAHISWFYFTSNLFVDYTTFNAIFENLDTRIGNLDTRIENLDNRVQTLEN